MTIHVVEQGDTINSIADKYNVSVDRLLFVNGKNETDRLVVGEAIVILQPEIVYTVQEGDTLNDIAERYGVTVIDLLRNNPYLSDREYIFPGETIVISYEGEKLRSIATNGYAFPFINTDTLRKTLPFLTYITVFSYHVTATGEINDIDDIAILQEAKKYGVAPILLLVPLSENEEDEMDVIHSIISNPVVQENLYNNLVRILRTKGYKGVNFSTPYLRVEDRGLYEEFILKAANRISAEGYQVFDIFNIRIFQLLTGTIFDGIDFSVLNQVLDGIGLIAFTFGYSEGIPTGTVSLDTFRRFWEYALRLISPEKAEMGLSVNGYTWELPYIPFVSRGMSVSYEAAITAALNENTEIQFDEITNTAYFYYISTGEFIVRFWDARSIDNFLNIVQELGIHSIGIWNIMSWFPQMWSIINSKFYIERMS